ncbi:LIC10173 family protein [Leptospira santarosai]|uniref:LIC10173 family protein n=1 Tax=Leptospira santarosai TaxID=28183 RepID=UPI000773D7C7|nr:hypothetical protein [Leptospira santarosai]MDI7196297.1 hypothetical protein [Leptospira santarosai]MDI7202130.1 hypothetical protein [Leptospira santarosai]
MRKSHIDFLREMATSIEVDETILFPPEKFFEYQPPLDQIEEQIPCAIVRFSEPTNVLGKKIKTQLEKIIRGNSVFIKYAVRQVKQDFKYTIDFWMNDPQTDVGSTVANRGVLDQCLLFVSQRKWFKTEEQIPVRVRLGKSNVVDDPAKETGNYKLYLEVIFNDGLYTIEEEETLAGTELEAAEPIIEGV